MSGYQVSSDQEGKIERVTQSSVTASQEKSDVTDFKSQIFGEVSALEVFSR